jgi:hypothetical protein
MRTMGYLSATDAFRLLQAGLTVYVVSSPTDSCALPLEGAWVDGEGNTHYDCSAVVLNPETAHAIGRAYRQQCFIRITPCANGNSEVYLLRDSAFARQVALAYCGGYTADGDYLFTAVDGDRNPFEDGYTDWLCADVEFVPVR